MLSRNVDKNGILFQVIYNGQGLHFDDWRETDDCIYYLPLAFLVDNGYAEVIDVGCHVPFENIYLLDEEERVILGIPSKYDKAMRLKSEGMLNTEEFKYRIEFLTHVPDGDLLACELKGNLIACDNGQFLLSEEQYELIRKVEAFNSQSKEIKTANFNLRSFAEIKDLALQAGCELDSYLANENVFVPEKIKIEVGEDNQGYTVDPSIEIEENEKFKHTFDKMRKVQDLYPLQRENGERVRVVLNPEQKSNLESLKLTGGRHKTREQIRMLTERPTEFFDPDVFDLSDLYSDRVIEIGIYKPKFYPFVSPYKSNWIAGATVETPENGTTKISVENENDLALLNQSIKFAEENNNHLVSFNDAQIAIEDARFLSDMAERQLKNPCKPVNTDGCGRKVLIIEENAEEVGFAAQNRLIDKKDKYILYKNPFLQNPFTLKSHQEEGIAWLQYLFNSKASGCLMADDMGLGKTLQILYFIDWHSRKYPDHNPYLIVAPVSLLENWENEYNRFFGIPRLRVTRLISKDVGRHFNKTIVDKMQQMDIILTNYESLRIAQLNFCAVEFDIVALDEAQKIKTPGTLVTNACKAIKSNFKIAMTGTPVENSLLDLWCIMDYCVPGLLGNAKSFAAKYQNPLKNEDSDIISLGNEIHEKLGVYLMRRLKKDAAKDLPEKIEWKQKIEMPVVQDKYYRNQVNCYKRGIQPNMLVTIMGVREISEHPYLFEHTLHQHESDVLVETSARLQATISFLDRIKEKEEKVIIFADRKETQRMLQRICLDKYGIVAKIINGDTPSVVTRQAAGAQSRQASINEFQLKQGFNVIIMSPIAAGMGLNVTAANHVIHYSRHWNPAKENQATDRAYRIGQEKDVYVYYPMAISKEYKAFDETLDDLLSRKLALASSTIFPTDRVEVNPDELGHMLFDKVQVSSNNS